MNWSVVTVLLIVYFSTIDCLYVFNNPLCLKIKCLHDKIVIQRYTSCSTSHEEDTSKHLTFRGCEANACSTVTNSVDSGPGPIPANHCPQMNKCPIGSVGDGVDCQDIDECLESPCHTKSACHNLSPGFRCDPCPLGYTGKTVYGIGLDFARNNHQVI